jgi:hypothetical protein
MAENLITRIFNRTPVEPTSTAGVPGTQIYNGFIQSNELDSSINSQRQRYITYSEILANTAIVSAGVRYLTLSVNPTGK